MSYSWGPSYLHSPVCLFQSSAGEVHIFTGTVRARLLDSMRRPGCFFFCQFFVRKLWVKEEHLALPTQPSTGRKLNASPFLAAPLERFLGRSDLSWLKIVSCSLSNSDSDIIRLELCSVLLCLMSKGTRGKRCLLSGHSTNNVIKIPFIKITKKGKRIKLAKKELI